MSIVSIDQDRVGRCDRRWEGNGNDTRVSIDQDRVGRCDEKPHDPAHTIIVSIDQDRVGRCDVMSLRDITADS